MNARVRGSAHRDRETRRGPIPDGRLGNESGSILVLFAIFLPLFLICCAVVIDVGYWWANAKKTQIAADACALAAAQSIPGINPTSGVANPATGECVITPGGPDYVLTNLPIQGDASPEPLHTGTTVVWPYKGDPTLVEARVTMTVGTFFGRVVGLGGVKIARRAVAEQSAGVNDVAIHAHTTNCSNDAIVLNGKNIDIDGIVESNGFFEVNGETIHTGPATGGGPNNCLIKVNGTDLSFGGQPAPTRDPVPHPWPIYFIPGEHPFGWPHSCDFTGNNIIFDNPGGEIPSGVYCARESFEINAERMHGKITVFSPRIKVGGKQTRLEPSPRAVAAGKPLLFMHLANYTEDLSDDDPEPVCSFNHSMELNAEEIVWDGILFHPCGHININGAKNAALEGMIVAQTVRVNGENFKIESLGANKMINLVE